MTSFVSVSTGAARYQDISLNPQKLAGQCAKLKCCLNFEVDSYVENVKRMPGKDARLETLDSTYFQFKVDILKREITYSTDKSVPANLVTISAARAFEIIEMNKRGEKPERLAADGTEKPTAVKEFGDIIGQDDLTRFDKKKKKKKKGGNSNGGGGSDRNTQNRPRQEQKPQGEGGRNRNDRPQGNHNGGGNRKPKHKQGGKPNQQNNPPKPSPDA